MSGNEQKDSLFYDRSNTGTIVSYVYVVDMIVNRKRHKDAKGEESYIICPTCGKEIDYYWSEFAGVERAVCRTPGCFSWNKSLVPKKKPKLVLKKKPVLKLKKKPKLVLKKEII